MRSTISYPLYSTAYFAVQTTVLYYYLRREKEGADSGELARVFD